ncbi:MAG TPA: polysaccharide deacetylase family protein [Clostridiales bacterium]|nr:polysaccharide deacetylase family protein [Clostridiales bacterium]HPV01853.1 polysaccharide deacetylase family protein [Clostridiales bacterium]
MDNRYSAFDRSTDRSGSKDNSKSAVGLKPTAISRPAFRIKPAVVLLVTLLITALMLQGCASEKLQNGGTELQEPQGQLQGYDADGPDITGQPEGTVPDSGNGPDPGSDAEGESGMDSADGKGEQGNGDPANGNEREPIDLDAVKPNEAGRIMVVMFHRFVEKYEKGDKEYTMTFDAFRKLLETLYTSGYRLISLNDYLNGHIDVPAGCIPMVFTFDDGTAGQFSFIEEDGQLKVNPDSAVAIMEEFNRLHPDFGLKGTFFVNLGNETFGKTGTLQQRLQYLIDRGFEIGNHTYSHINLKTEAKTAEIIQKEVGGNQKRMYELVPGYAFTALALPYGAPSKNLMEYVIKGEYEGVGYENKAIMEVGWDPAQSPFSVKFDPLSTHRVRSPGIEPVEFDLEWWLKNMKRSNEFVSDGDPDTVTVPEAYADLVDQERLGGRKLVIY